MHLIAYQASKDKGTICHGFKLKQHKPGHKKTRYDERVFLSWWVWLIYRP